jgi:cytochrome P450
MIHSAMKSSLVSGSDLSRRLVFDGRAAGNVFVFLLAGHDTTSHSLAIILTLLALYPGGQGKSVQQIRELQQDEKDFASEWFQTDELCSLKIFVPDI